MFDEVSKPTAWYRSWPVLLVTAIILPPLGIALVWTRRDFDLPLKALASVMLVALGAGYLYLIFGAGEDRYTALERHRAQQQQQAATAQGPESQTPGAQALPGAAGAQQANAPGAAGDPAQQAASAAVEGQPSSDPNAAPGGAQSPAAARAKLRTNSAARS